jgi:hypothetical protein
LHPWKSLRKGVGSGVWSVSFSQRYAPKCQGSPTLLQNICFTSGFDWVRGSGSSFLEALFKHAASSRVPLNFLSFNEKVAVKIVIWLTGCGSARTQEFLVRSRILFVSGSVSSASWHKHMWHTDTYSPTVSWKSLFSALKLYYQLYVVKNLKFILSTDFADKMITFGRLEWRQNWINTFSYFLAFLLSVDMWRCTLGPPCAQRWLPRRTSWARKPLSGCSERLRQSKSRHKYKEIMLPIKQGLCVSNKLSMPCIFS